MFRKLKSSKPAVETPEPTEKDEIIYRTPTDFTPLTKSSQITNTQPNDLLILTKKEKSSLLDIKSLVSRTRVPIDNRKLIFYNRDAEKFSTKIDINESDVPLKVLQDAAGVVKESPEKIIATDVNSLGEFLIELRNLIARREIAWAEATDQNYAYKLEIIKMKSEVNHLRVVANKRLTDLGEKDRMLAEKDGEIDRLNRLVQKLKIGIINLAKNGEKNEETSEVIQEAEKSGKNPVVEVKNGPAARLANALHRARTAAEVNL